MNLRSFYDNFYYIGLTPRRISFTRSSCLRKDFLELIKWNKYASTLTLLSRLKYLIKGRKRREKIYQKQHNKARSKESFKLSSTDAVGRFWITK